MVTADVAEGPRDTVVPPGGSARTLAETVRRFACDGGDAAAVTFVDHTSSRRGRVHALTYAELDLRARALAAELASRCTPDGRVAIMCPHDPTYIVAFLGCLYAGVVAVPLYAPEAVRANDRLRHVLLDSTPEWILTSSASRDAVVSAQRTELRAPIRGIICVDDVPDASAARYQPPEVALADVAYLQYTSGSTSEPSGVRVTHGNIAAAARQFELGAPWLSRDTALVSWVPYFHDLGLITGVVVPLSAGAHGVHLSPTAFIQEPYRWLALISQYRAACTASPNFGLDLCTRRVTAEQRETLDLSHLRVLLNGSEPVRSASWDSFISAFGPCGLRPEVHSPGYGLAEATLGVTNFLDDDAPHLVLDLDRAALSAGRVALAEPGLPSTTRLVSCGTPLDGVDIRIVDPEAATELAAGLVGEVWVAGPNVADGYWQQPERTERVFGARLRGPDGQPDGGRWLRTGDLGFTHDDQYYIAARRKEVVIIAGRNHYPADLEATAQAAHPGIRPNGIAAFGVTGNGEEKLVLVVEVSAGTDRDQIAAAVRYVVSDVHGCYPHDVALVRPGAIPRTTSRKVQRGACRDRYLAGDLGGAGTTEVPA